MTSSTFADVVKDMVEIGINLTTDQKNAVESILLRKDVLAVMPTGTGKSMIFQGIAHSLAKRCSRDIVIVVTPLNSISFLHVKTLETVRTF